MQKKKKLIKVIMAVSVAAILTASGIASTGSWVEKSDTCKNKCKITDYEYTCGICGSSMSSKFEKWEGNYMIYKFTCNNNKKKNCTHSCKYKLKGN